MTTYEIEETILRSMMDRNFKVFGVSMEIACMFEADVFGINNNGYIYEYEIKQSRSDFKADFKKKKHKHMANGDAVRCYYEWIKGKRTNNKIECIKIPNRFFFVCNEGLILPDEVPEYAGLIYVKDGVDMEVKPSKLIHRIKANEGVYKSIATKKSSSNLPNLKRDGSFDMSYWEVISVKMCHNTEPYMVKYEKIDKKYYPRD